MNFFSSTLVIIIFPSRRKTITSSISEQSATYSSFLSPVPKKPSSRLTYNLVLRSTTLVASMVSKLRNSVWRSRPLPYLSFSFWKKSMVKSMMLSKWCFTSSISASNFAIASSALSESKRVIRIIGICVNFCKSSSLVSRTNDFLNGSNRSYMYLYNDSLSPYNLKSMYISSRMKIFSKVEKCHLFSNSSNWISNSRFNKSTVRCVEIFNISETPMNNGLLSSITQPKGATEDSQAVNAYNASIILSGETPGGR